MLQMLGSILIISATSALGIASRQQLVKRTKILHEWILAIDIMRAEVEQNHTPLPDILEMLSTYENSPLCKIFLCMINHIKEQPSFSIGYHWHSAIRDNADEFNMQPKEIEVLRNMSTFLGMYQAEHQLSGFSHTQSQLNNIYNEALLELKNKGSVYRMCGIAAGVITVLLML